MWLPLGPRSPGSHYAPPIHLRESLTASEISAIGLSNEVSSNTSKTCSKASHESPLTNSTPQQQPRDAITPGNLARVQQGYDPLAVHVYYLHPSEAALAGSHSAGIDRSGVMARNLLGMTKVLDTKGQERGSKIGTKIDS